jgi:hypothetical protein
MRILSRTVSSIIAGAIALSALPAGAANAAKVASPSAPMAQGDIEVSSQRYYRRGYGYRRGIGPGAAFGIIAGTIGAVAAANAYRRNYYYQPYGYYGGGYARPYYGPGYGYYGGPGYYRGW